MSEAPTVYSLARPPASDALRHGPLEAVRSALAAVRQRTLAQARAWREALGPGLEVPYAPERNPPMWELGHMAWFQEWWIARNRQRSLGHRADPDHARPPSILADADSLYDSSRVAHRSRWSLPLPDFEGTLDYLARTQADTLEGLDELDASPVHAGEHALYFFRLVALHEAMHAEAGDYMARGLGIAWIERPQPRIASEAQLALPAQAFQLGAPAQGFAFDNERRAHAVELAAATIDAEPVSWGRYLPFVEAGGYADEQWWTPAGREWLAAQPVRLPRYLRRGRGGWEARRGGSWQALDASEAAIHLSLHEARAWCRWAGRSLPTEAQWECAALTLPDFRWGHAWEWTASRFEPFAGFQAHPYRDYSAPWFGTRFVLRGACPATDESLAHPRYRNFFEPHRADVFAGFRSVSGASAAKAV